jgi:hypothetical protein
MRREEVLASLLSVVAGDQVALGEKSEVWSARQALVITAGAFTGLDVTPKNVTPVRLARAGIQSELANRLLAGEVIGMVPPPRRELVRVLERWPELLSIRQAARRLGFTLSVPEATLYRAAALITDGLHGDTVRSAGGTLVSAARHHLVAALEEGADGNVLVITPDDIRTHRMAAPTGDPRQDPPDELPAFR